MTPLLENGIDLVAKRRSISKHNRGLGCITEKPCAKSGEKARSQNAPTQHGDHGRILKSVPSTIAHNRFLITATLALSPDSGARVSYHAVAAAARRFCISSFLCACPC